MIFFLPNKFSTRVEITTDGKESTDVEMNFDYDRRKAAITLESRDTRTDLIFNYETDEIYLVECMFSSITKLITNSSFYFLFHF